MYFLNRINHPFYKSILLMKVSQPFTALSTILVSQIYSSINIYSSFRLQVIFVFMTFKKCINQNLKFNLDNCFSVYSKIKRSKKSLKEQNFYPSSFFKCIAPNHLNSVKKSVQTFYFWKHMLDSRRIQGGWLPLYH